ncbi:MAG: GH36-type glycosyl hydrolase domain-containing protein [Bacteroidota bacterium]
MQISKDTTGGKAGKGKLWEFTEKNNGSFVCPEPQEIKRLFFPIMNRYGMKCSVTPELKGDICSSFHSYHSTPVVTEDFHRVVNNRNFWIRTRSYAPWSITGVSVWEKAGAFDIETTAEGEVGLFHLKKSNYDLKLESNITIFVPPTEDFVELMIVKVKNKGETAVDFTPWAAVPLYGRSADNLRDHRNVTTMFIENYRENHGVRIKPRINFNEFGHSDNPTSYLVLGYDEDGNGPTDIIRTVRDFAGEGGSLEKPRAVIKNLSEKDLEELQVDGFEAIGGLKFKDVTLQPGEEKSFIIINGITDNPEDQEKWKKRFGTLDKIEPVVADTRKYWQKIVNEVSFETGDSTFDNWTKWVNYQLICRQVYGNSYLPDFGYGRGGRGWRDLFSDLLSIFLIDPENAKQEIINNFNGIRVDGTNATIVGTKPGEFVADRNNVPRTWSDHGTWPFFVLNFYMQQTGDFNVLFQEVSYWKDMHVFRSRKTDEEWSESYGFKQKTKEGKLYTASILEHILMQHFCSFFNVGKHNNILLEGADWNDTYDMARQRGESVCFYNWYGSNMKTLASLLGFLKERGITTVPLLKEMLMLMDTMAGNEKVDYRSPEKRKGHLLQYYELVKHNISGEKVEVNVDDIITDLEAKAEEVFNHVRQNEWLTTKEGYSFYNGHYDNDENRVHGDNPKGVRIDLTSQVLPTIFGTATNEQIPVIYKSVRHYLRDNNTGGLHLCSDFNENKLYFGRLTGFVYGHKEHGGKWMQQNVMYMYGLYKRGFVKEGYEVYKDVYKLCNDSGTAKIFPGIPSYFELDGHGAYHYLTGSATWLMLALVTQVFGIRGNYGNLIIEPKLVKEQFENDKKAVMNCNFRNKKLRVVYHNVNNKDYPDYKIKKLLINGQEIPDVLSDDNKSALFSIEKFDGLFKDTNILEIELD